MMEGEKTIVYLAGPTGVDKYWEVFEAADDDLTGRSFTVLNPARLPSNLAQEDAMPICMAMIQAADAIVLLPGWEHSDGTKLEKAFAEKLGKAVWTQEFITAFQSLAAEDAKRIREAVRT